MIFASLLVVLFTIGAFGSVVRSLVRQHARERDLLLNQIMHLTGKTWTPPPSEPKLEVEDEPRATVRSPEQWPDTYDFAGSA